MVWLSHNYFSTVPALLGVLAALLHRSSEDHHLRQIKPAVFKTTVHNQSLPYYLLTNVSYWPHVAHSSSTYLSVHVFLVTSWTTFHTRNSLTPLDTDLHLLLNS